MGLLPDTLNCGLRMRLECWERFPRHWFQRKLLISDPGMHHGTCVTHVPWCMSGSLTPGGGENVPDIPGACAIRNFAYLVRGPLCAYFIEHTAVVTKLYSPRLLRSAYSCQILHLLRHYIHLKWYTTPIYGTYCICYRMTHGYTFHIHGT